MIMEKEIGNASSAVGVEDKDLQNTRRLSPCWSDTPSKSILELACDIVSIEEGGECVVIDDEEEGLDRDSKQHRQRLERIVADAVDNRLQNIARKLAARSLTECYNDYRDVFKAFSYLSAIPEAREKIMPLLPNIGRYLQTFSVDLEERLQRIDIKEPYNMFDVADLLQALVSLIPEGSFSRYSSHITTTLNNVELFLHTLTRNQLLQQIKDFRNSIQNLHNRMEDNCLLEKYALQMLIDRRTDISLTMHHWYQFIQELQTSYSESNAYAGNRYQRLCSWHKSVATIMQNGLLEFTEIARAQVQQFAACLDKLDLNAELPLGDITKIMKFYLEAKRSLQSIVPMEEDRTLGVGVVAQYAAVYTTISMILQCKKEQILGQSFKQPCLASLVGLADDLFNDFNERYAELQDLTTPNFSATYKVFEVYQNIRELVHAWGFWSEFYKDCDINQFEIYKKYKQDFETGELAASNVFDKLAATFDYLAKQIKDIPYPPIKTVEDIFDVLKSIREILKDQHGHAGAQGFVEYQQCFEAMEKQFHQCCSRVKKNLEKKPLPSPSHPFTVWLGRKSYYAHLGHAHFRRDDCYSNELTELCRDYGGLAWGAHATQVVCLPTSQNHGDSGLRNQVL
jgi:hypothetical protein